MGFFERLLLAVESAVRAFRQRFYGRRPLPVPGPITPQMVQPLREEFVMAIKVSALRLRVELPQVQDTNEVAVKRLTVTARGDHAAYFSKVHELPGVAGSVEILVPENQYYDLQLDYGDNSQNPDGSPNPNWTLGQKTNYFARDLVPPEAPGPFGEIRQIAEESVEIPEEGDGDPVATTEEPAISTTAEPVATTEEPVATTEEPAASTTEEPDTGTSEEPDTSTSEEPAGGDETSTTLI